MSGCTVVPIVTGKACSGKCRGGSCDGAPRVWVVAACEGMVSVFEKGERTFLPVLQDDSQVVFASLDDFKNALDVAEHARTFDQLVIVGSSNDIAWIHASLPSSATRHIAAEIEYPLLPAWFRQPASALPHALERVFAH